MVRYSVSVSNPEKSCKARGDYVPSHYKKVYNVAHAIKGFTVTKALKFLADVLEHKQAVPFTRYLHGVGRHAQGKAMKAPGNQSCWPQDACKAVMGLVENAKANGETKGLDLATLRINHIHVNRAPLTRRRSYRAHGRINPFQSHPCHIEMICTVPEEKIAKPTDGKVLKLSRKQIAQKRLHLKEGEK